MQKYTQNTQKQSGFIALSLIILIAAIVIGIGTSIALLSIGEGQSGLALTKGEGNLEFVEGCMEDALLKIKNNSAYAGGSITRPEGTCTITVSQSGATYTVTATTTDPTYTRKIQAIVNLSGNNLTLTSWSEI